MNKNLSTKFKGGARELTGECKTLYELHKRKLVKQDKMPSDQADEQSYQSVRYLSNEQCRNIVNGIHELRDGTLYSDFFGGNNEEDYACAKYFDKLVKYNVDPGVAFRTVYKLEPLTCEILMEPDQVTNEKINQPQNNVQEEQQTNKEKLKQDGGAKKGKTKKSSKKVSKKGSKKVSKKGSKKVSKKGSKIILGGAKKSSKTSKTSKPKKSSKKSSKKSKKM
jgi:hypothetical protein